MQLQGGKSALVAVSYHDTVGKLQAPAGQAASPFDRLGWFELLERHGARPVVVEARDGKNAVAAILTASGPSRLRSLHHVFAFSWQPTVLSGSPGSSVYQAIARDLRSRAWRIDLTHVPEDDGFAELLATSFRAAGWAVRCEPCDENHILEVKGRTFARYWAERPGPLRTTLKRKAGRVEVEIIDSFSERIWKAYQEVYANSWKSEEKDILLLRDFALEEADAGRLRMGVAWREDQPIAAQLWTVEDATAYIHKLCYDEEQKTHSAGTTLSAAMFERAIDHDKVQRIDFGTGSDAYKRDWMESVRLRYALSCIKPWSIRGAAYLAARPMVRVAQRFGRS